MLPFLLGCLGFVGLLEDLFLHIRRVLGVPGCVRVGGTGEIGVEETEK